MCVSVPFGRNNGGCNYDILIVTIRMNILHCILTIIFKYLCVCMYMYVCMYVLTYALAFWQVVAVDWAASSLRQEGDVIIQAILQAIVKLAIEC